MPWITAGASLLGGLFSGNSASNAADTQANAQLEAARIAADAAKFRPVGVTTAFGTSNFGKDASGNVTSAGYTLSPEMAAQRDLLMKQMGTSGMGMVGQAAQGGQSLFNLGQGYVAQSPEAAAQQWMASQNKLLQPGNEQAYAKLKENQQNTGRGGLSMAQGGDLAMANPDAAAYYNSLAQQQAGLAAQAQAQGRAQTTFGQGLMGAGVDLTTAGYNPYKVQLGLAQNLETTGQNALDIGSALGGKVTAANTNAGNILNTGMTNAASTMNKANAWSPWGDALTLGANNPTLMSGISNTISGWGSPFQGTGSVFTDLPRGSYN